VLSHGILLILYQIVILQVVCHDSLLERILIVGCARTGHECSLFRIFRSQSYYSPVQVQLASGQITNFVCEYPSG
jgi:hypothetical protein